MPSTVASLAGEESVLGSLLLCSNSERYRDVREAYVEIHLVVTPPRLLHRVESFFSVVVIEVVLQCVQIPAIAPHGDFHGRGPTYIVCV